jgi:hypothetical protein
VRVGDKRRHSTLRRIGLTHTHLVQSGCGGIRLKLLQIGVLVQISVCRIEATMASACSHQPLALREALHPRRPVVKWIDNWRRL